MLINHFRLSPPFPYYLGFGLITMVIVESLGYNCFKIRLEKPYPNLLPCLNCMHAPASLYLYYALVAVGYYFSMRWLLALKPAKLNMLGILRSGWK